jgi:Periplasmic copper-binding protein (NosD)
MIEAVIKCSRPTPSPQFTGISGRALVMACSLAWLLAPAVVRANDYWVGPKGRDATEHGSRTRPWASLQYAADRVLPSDTVHVRDGDYQGFDLRHGGTKDAVVCFRAEGKRVRIVRRNDRTPDGINVEGANYVVIEGFIVNEMPRTGVRGVTGSHLTIRGIRADRNGVWGILIAHCDDAAVIGNETSRSVEQHGIYIGNCGDRPIVRGNIVWGNQICGIHMNGASPGCDGIISGAVVENNVIFDNGRKGGSGINCDGVQDSVFRNNLLYDNHASGISLYRIDGAEGPKDNRVVNNTIVMARDARWALNILEGRAGNTAWNNILLNDNPARGSINIGAESLAGFRSDHNIVSDRFSADDGGHVWSLERWRNGTGLDRHSRTAVSRDLFTNAAKGDFHLRADSPAIGAADPSTSPEQDLDGRSRASDSSPDIGAFERAGDLRTRP